MHKVFSPATSIVMVGLLLGLLLGCSNRPNDDAITKDIQNRVASDPDTKDSSVSVVSNDAKVTLKGTASNKAAQQKLEQIARHEPGIAAVDNQTVVPPPPPIVVPVGTELIVTIGRALGSKTSQTGQTFLASVAQPVTVGGRTAIPKASAVSGTVLVAKEKGKIKGEGQLSLTLKSITVGGQVYPLETNTLDSTVKGKGKRTAATTGGGAAGGALIGGIAGGGKGAGIGALVGAGAGFFGSTFTGNKQIELPAESALTFSFSAPLTLPRPQ